MGDAWSASVLAVAIAFITQVTMGVILWSWGRRIAKRAKAPFWSAAAWLPVGSLLIAVGGVAGVFFQLATAFSAAAIAAPSEKASTLAMGVSEAMNWGGFVAAIAGMLYFGCFVLFAIGSMRIPRAA
jgi:hypothetical protein